MMEPHTKGRPGRPRRLGRLTLNPLAHLDPIGSLLLVGLPNLYGAWLMSVYGFTQHAGLAENVLVPAHVLGHAWRMASRVRAGRRWKRSRRSTRRSSRSSAGAWRRKMISIRAYSGIGGWH